MSVVLSSITILNQNIGFGYIRIKVKKYPRESV